MDGSGVEAQSADGETYKLYAAWLARLELGGEEDFVDICRDRPEHAPGLRRLHSEQTEVRRLLQRYFLGEQPGPVGPEPTSEDESREDLFASLVEREPSRARYRLDGELARGGMGKVLRVWDGHLRRHLAMKVSLGPSDASTQEASPLLEARSLARFLEEAQITGQLDHPGIVPVHELGLDASGALYFTMKLVKGRDLRAILELVHYEAQGWSIVRALGVLLKVCEAMRYAHAKGVIHRDLKPANVMVGDYGEVYVMDWGLARILDRPEQRDAHLRLVETTLLSGIRSAGRGSNGSTPDSPFDTLDGDVVGTPYYMPPEQACGELTALGPHSDVYAVGAMLYQLLAGHPPYAHAEERVDRREVWRRVREGPPTPLRSAAPSAAPELIAICERAMARDPRARYPDMSDLAADLSAFLEGRVVAAYETGTLAEAKKWVLRHRSFAFSLGALLLILAVGVVRSVHHARGESRVRAAAETRRDAALERERELRVRGLIQDLAEFRSHVHSSTFAWEQSRPTFQWWTEWARLLVEGSSATSDAELPSRPGLADVEAWLATNAAPAAIASESRERWWHDQLSTLADDLRRLREQLERVESTLPAWDRAKSAVAASPRYGGLRLAPQVGLVPIGPDPSSGLWEFANLETGEVPHRDSEGRVVPFEGMALVFVLLPGDVARGGDEDTVHTQQLAPFFLSKYELTRGQWSRAGGAPREPTGDLLPMIDVDRSECLELPALRDAWITLPTDAQLAFARRALGLHELSGNGLRPARPLTP